MGSVAAQSERQSASTPRAPAAPEPAGAPLGSQPGAVSASVPARVGVVSHYFANADAAALRLESELRVGDTVHIRGHTTDYYQRVDRIEIDHAPVVVARTGQEIGLHVAQRVREHDEVFKLSR